VVVEELRDGEGAFCAPAIAADVLAADVRTPAFVAAFVDDFFLDADGLVAGAVDRDAFEPVREVFVLEAVFRDEGGLRVEAISRLPLRWLHP
jgi:hypothetical protein